MTAWGWADSGRARSTAGLESSDLLRPMPASVAAAAEALARARVRAASAAAAEVSVVVAAVAVAGVAANWARTLMAADRAAAAVAVGATANLPASANARALR